MTREPPKDGKSEWHQGDWKVNLRIAAIVVAVFLAIIVSYVLTLVRG